MIRTNRFQVVLLLALGLTIGLLGCESESGGSSGGVLRILVTNDDGIEAPGIDAVVEALRVDPNNEIVVSAPITDRSGSGDDTVETNPEDCGTGDVMPSSTASGYDEATWAVDGCPADCVIYALENLYPDAPPHVVLSGLNDSQNVGNLTGTGLLSQVSGTVGAAKTAACADVPALASSQGEGDTIDFDAGVAEVLRWLEDNRAALLAGEVPVEKVENITSINIPSCDTGEIRGRVHVPLATEAPDGFNFLGPQDCESTVENPQDDFEAFFNGYVAVTPVPRNSSNTCDKLNE
jgi:5'-nucleotidase